MGRLADKVRAAQQSGPGKSWPTTAVMITGTSDAPSFGGNWSLLDATRLVLQDAGTTAQHTTPLLYFWRRIS